LDGLITHIQNYYGCRPKMSIGWPLRSCSYSRRAAASFHTAAE
jgi:hypothetical protein